VRCATFCPVFRHKVEITWSKIPLNKRAVHTNFLTSLFQSWSFFFWARCFLLFTIVWNFFFLCNLFLVNVQLLTYLRLLSFLYSSFHYCLRRDFNYGTSYNIFLVIYSPLFFISWNIHLFCNQTGQCCHFLSSTLLLFILPWNPVHTLILMVRCEMSTLSAPICHPSRCFSNAFPYNIPTDALDSLSQLWVALLHSPPFVKVSACLENLEKSMHLFFFLEKSTYVLHLHLENLFVCSTNFCCAIWNLSKLRLRYCKPILTPGILPTYVNLSWSNVITLCAGMSTSRGFSVSK